MPNSVDHQSDESVLRWLHITDLHVGHKNESQQTALASLVAAIENFAHGKPFDLILLTGDLAYSGHKNEYDALRAQLIEPLRATFLCAKATFHAVPGNHDLDCEIGFPPAWNNLGKSRQESFFHLDESGTRTRAARAEAFAEYQNFVKSAGIESVDPTKAPASVKQVIGKRRTFAVVSAVTAFFSDKDVPDSRKAPAPTHPVRTILQGLSPDTVTIILGHHPVDWFLPETERHFHSLLVEQKALYLHGHEHCIKSKFGGRGLTSLGFGAGYIAPSDAPPVSYYRNSFAICEMTDSLHISVVSWDSENGQWRSDQNLPGDFTDRSDRLPDGYCLSLPSTRILEQSNRAYASIASAIRTETYIETCIWLADGGPKRWTDLLSSIGELRDVVETYALPTQTLPAGHSLFRVKDQRGQYLIRAVSGHGDILNYEQLEAVNTELDKQDYDGSIVATLGELSTEAQTLATQLASRKPIAVLERSEIVRRVIRNLPNPLRSALLQVDPTAVSGSLVITTTGFALVLQDRTTDAWFYVLGNDGTPLAESDSLILRLREEVPSLRTQRYEPTGDTGLGNQGVKPEVQAFDRQDYLLKNYSYFDDVKYAPLAALGFRFRKASLAEIYVTASADVGGPSKTSQNLTRAVSEFVESLNLPQAQRDQLESQLRSRYGMDRTAEVGAARRLYQRYNNVVVVGDPGSGKTCFVKHEILAYCSPPPEQGSWYSQHLPIYVSLAEAARLLNDRTDLLDICEIVSSRRGIALARKVIENALSEGRAAFFFDGLDEVGYIDKRIALVSEIDGLVKKFAPRGNRFVLASRPAATQPVDIPDALTYLQLKGLTEDEIRTLAGRVLTIRLGNDDDKGLSSEETELVDRLLEDTRNRPGIARLARNPLLLTLLVLIYANTGALSSRRHLIYTQAIKTLVGVRGRQTREQQISEADLRTRLGALALGIFSREIAEIPRRSEVLKVLSPLMANGSPPSVATPIVNAFIQEVAEATGLLAIHPAEDLLSEDLITFMHYSFLEYYAAAGLLGRDYSTLLPRLSANPRWKDVTTLLFGILSEQSDVTPLLIKILSDGALSDDISNYKLLLALECASECDVPPEAAQDLLANAVYETLSKGAARYSTDLRSKIASRLEYFLQGAGARIESALIRSLKDNDPMCAAASADLLARFGDSVKLSKDIADAFAHCLAREHPVARAAVMFAIERRPELRSKGAEGVVQASLSGSVIEKHAALKVITAVPAYHLTARKEVRELLDDPNGLISATAARCMLANALQGGQWLEESAVQEKILGKLNQNDQEDGLSLHGITLDRETIEHLVLSGKKNEIELALRYVPLIRNDDQFVYQLLLQSLRSMKEPRHRAACLDSLRMSPRALDLITIADTDLICACRKASERNVRIATIRLLGEMPDDEQVVQNLQEHLAELASASSKEEEVTEAAKALSKHVRRNQRLRLEVLSKLLQHIPKTAEVGFGDDMNQHHLLGLLLVCESIGGVTDQATAQKLLSFAESFRTPLSIRKQAMRVFGRIAEPSVENVETFVRLLKRNDPILNESTYSASASFVSQCRGKVEYVRRVYGELSELRDQLCEAWRREIAISTESIDPRGPRDIRDAVVEIETLISAYDEFAEGATISAG